MYDDIMSKQDREDIDKLHAIAVVHGNKQDGQDAEVIDAIQKIQKVIMCRAGGTAYLLAKKYENEKAQTNGGGNEGHGPDKGSGEQLRSVAGGASNSL